MIDVVQAEALFYSRVLVVTTFGLRHSRQLCDSGTLAFLNRVDGLRFVGLSSVGATRPLALFL